MTENGKTTWPLTQLENWEKNPRTITEADTERLKKQLLNLGQYKPLIIVVVGEQGIVLGGNMRLKAMRELVEEGHKQFENIWVAPVEAPDDKRKLEYALSDNDRAGQYQEDELVEIMRGVGDDFPLDEYHIDTAYHIGLDTLGDRYDMADVRARPMAPGGADDDLGPVDTSKVKDAKVKFDNATIKQIVLYFANKEYAWALDFLKRVQEITGTENNTDAFIAIAKEYEENHPSEDSAA